MDVMDVMLSVCFHLALDWIGFASLVFESAFVCIACLCLRLRFESWTCTYLQILQSFSLGDMPWFFLCQVCVEILSCSVCVELWTSTKAWPLRCSTVANGWSLGWSPGRVATTSQRSTEPSFTSFSPVIMWRALHVIKPIQSVTCNALTKSKWLKFGILRLKRVETLGGFRSFKVGSINCWALQRSELGESSSACFKTEQHTAEIYKWNPHLDHGRRGANRSN